MKRYPKYKDSGVKWIGEIPEHWNVPRLKSLCISMKSGDNLTALDIKENGAYKVYGGNGIRGYYHLCNVSKECILIGRQGALCGNVHYVNEPIWATDHAVVTFSAKNTDIKYLFHLTTAMNLNQYASQTAAQPGLAVGAIGRIYTCLPPLDEQQAIVAYLDEKVGKIDRYINEKEKEIVVLDELKQATIANAVTRGLDPNAPLKDSGIKWIGNIPQHWEVKRLAMQFSENKTKNSDYEYQRACKFNYGRIVPKNEVGDVSELKETYIAYTKVKLNDIVINNLNLNYDFVSQRVAIVENDGIITSAYLTITPRKDVFASFYKWFFKAMDSKKLFHGMGTGIRLTLSYNELKKQQILVPPIEEQQAIVDYINTKTAKIDQMKDGIKSEIEKLKEYKQRLISDVVTGKVCVKGEK